MFDEKGKVHTTIAAATAIQNVTPDIADLLST